MAEYVNSTWQAGKALLFYDDFSTGFNPAAPTSSYEFINVPIIPYTSNDGVATTSPSGLSISSVPFTWTFPGALDDHKYFVVTKKVLIVPTDGSELVLETIASAQQTGLSGLPAILQAPSGSLDGVSDANSDFRLASAYPISLYDPVTNMFYGFVLTNEDIYAVYSRAPQGMIAFGGTQPNYNAWFSAIPVGKRDVLNPLNDYAKLAVVYNYKYSYVKWLVNGNEVFQVARPGYQLERKYRTQETNNLPPTPPFPDTLQRSTQFVVLLGTATTFYMTNPQNPGQVPNLGLLDENLPLEVDPTKTDVFGNNVVQNFVANYGDPPLNGSLFGQGAILNMKYLVCYLLAPPRIENFYPNLFSSNSSVLLSKSAQNAINGVNADTDLSLYVLSGSIAGYPPNSFPKTKAALLSP